MHIRAGIVTLFLACSPLTISGQAPMSLQAADQAFADALSHHDRAAFMALLSPEATSSLPVAKHGRDAIAASWLPFLIDPGTTMVLTCVDVRPGPAGDSGATTGTLAVTGRTNQGIQTVPLGTYVIEWTMMDGHWKISTLGGTLGRKPAAE
jgi:ketosteroid isomerase-like protein